MAKGAGTIFEQAIKKNKQKISEMIAQRYLLKASAVVSRSMNDKDWGNFTGNAITSFSAVAYIPGVGIFSEYTSGKMMPKPVHSKVEKDKVLTLEVDYDGRTNQTRRGMVDIEKKTSAEAVEYIKNRKQRVRQLFALIRLSHPVEYENYIKTTGGITHIVKMHNDAMIMMK